MAINYLIFGGVNSQDYGVYISSEVVYGTPERAVDSVDVPGRNGALLIDQGHWNNITAEYTAGTFAESAEDFAEKISTFRNAIASQIGYQRLSDTYNPNEYRMAAFVSGIEVETVNYNEAGEFKLVFDCKPQRWLTDGETPISVSDGAVVANPTLYDARPLLAIKGYGSVGFNGYNVEVDNGVIGEIEVMQSSGGSVQGQIGNVSFPYDESQINTGDALTLTNARAEVLLGINHQFVTITGATAESSEIDVRAFVEGNLVRVSAYFPDIRMNYPHGEFIAHIDVTVNARVSGAPVTYTTTINLRILDSGSDAQPSIYFYYSAQSQYFPGRICGFSSGTLIADSTVPALGDPTFIDCEAGEAYKIVDGEMVSLNRYIALGSDLPALAPGDNTFTVENTITELKVTPNWWKL